MMECPAYQEIRDDFKELYDDCEHEKAVIQSSISWQNWCIRCVFSEMKIQSGFSIYSLIDLSQVMTTVVVTMMEMNWSKWIKVSLGFWKFNLVTP